VCRTRCATIKQKKLQELRYDGDSEGSDGDYLEHDAVTTRTVGEGRGSGRMQLRVPRTGKKPVNLAPPKKPTDGTRFETLSEYESTPSIPTSDATSPPPAESPGIGADLDSGVSSDVDMSDTSSFPLDDTDVQPNADSDKEFSPSVDTSSAAFKKRLYEAYHGSGSYPEGSSETESKTHPTTRAASIELSDDFNGCSFSAAASSKLNSKKLYEAYHGPGTYASRSVGHPSAARTPVSRRGRAKSPSPSAVGNPLVRVIREIIIGIKESESTFVTPPRCPFVLPQDDDEGFNPTFLTPEQRILVIIGDWYRTGAYDRIVTDIRRDIAARRYRHNVKGQKLRVAVAEKIKEIGETMEGCMEERGWASLEGAGWDLDGMAKRFRKTGRL